MRGRSVGLLLVMNSDAGSIEEAVGLMGRAQHYNAECSFDLCEQTYERALSLLQSQLPEDDKKIINCLKDIALMYQVRCKNSEAEAYYRRLLEILAPKPACTDLSEVLVAMAEIFKDEGRFSEAEAALIRLTEVTQQLLGAEHPEVAQHMIDLAEIYDESAKYEKAAEQLRLALQILRKARGPNHQQSATCLKKLIAVQEKDRKRRELSGAEISWQG